MKVANVTERKVVVVDLVNTDEVPSVAVLIRIKWLDRAQFASLFKRDGWTDRTLSLQEIFTVVVKERLKTGEENIDDR